MPALQVRELPDELYERLRACAMRNHRSIAQQTTAFIEQGLALDELVVNGASDQNDIPIPPNVREAAERAKTVNPFSWLALYDFEPREALEMRRQKREKLKEQVSALSANAPELELAQIAALVHRSRDEREDHIMGLVAQHLDSNGAA